jgi:hypothetical protein
VVGVWRGAGDPNGRGAVGKGKFKCDVAEEGVKKEPPVDDRGPLLKAASDGVVAASNPPRAILPRALGLGGTGRSGISTDKGAADCEAGSSSWPNAEANILAYDKSSSASRRRSGSGSSSSGGASNPSCKVWRNDGVELGI